MNAKSIKDILLDYLEVNTLVEINNSINLEQTWKTIVGKAIAKNTKIIKFKKGILTIKTSNPIWRNELFLQKTELINKINKTELKFNITEIIFR